MGKRKKNVQESKKRKSTTKEYREVVLNDNWSCLSWIGDNFYISKNGEIWNSKTNRILKGSIRNGYLRVNLLNKLYLIHCLVFEAFHGYRPKYIDHIDGNRVNNSLENLRETTQSDNMKNAMSKGHACQVPILQFDKEGNFIKEYPSIQAAANEMEVARESILSSISRNGTCKGFRWEKEKSCSEHPLIAGNSMKQTARFVFFIWKISNQAVKTEGSTTIHPSRWSSAQTIGVRNGGGHTNVFKI